MADITVSQIVDDVMQSTTAAEIATLILPAQTGNSGKYLTTDGTASSWATVSSTGTVTSVSVTTANGVSGTVANATTTPAITLSLGDITPSSVNGIALSGASGSGINLSASGTLTIGSNAVEFSSSALTVDGTAYSLSGLSGVIALGTTQAIRFGGATAARTYTMPDANETIVGTTTTQTLTNKTIALGSNTVSGTLAQLDSAITDANIARTDAGNTSLSVRAASGTSTFQVQSSADATRGISLTYSTAGIATVSSFGTVWLYLTVGSGSAATYLDGSTVYIRGGATTAITVSGANATVAGTFGVTGATTLSSTLAVTGAATITGQSNLNGHARLNAGLSGDAFGEATNGGSVTLTTITSRITPASAGEEWSIPDSTRDGQIKIIFCGGSAGSAILTPDTGAGWTSAEIDSPGDNITIQWLSGTGWILLASHGATIT